MNKKTFGVFTTCAYSLYKVYKCKVIHLNGVQTRLKCKPNVKQCNVWFFQPVLSYSTITF